MVEREDLVAWVVALAVVPRQEDNSQPVEVAVVGFGHHAIYFSVPHSIPEAT